MQRQQKRQNSALSVASRCCNYRARATLHADPIGKGEQFPVEDRRQVLKALGTIHPPKQLYVLRTGGAPRRRRRLPEGMPAGYGADRRTVVGGRGERS